MKLSTARAIFGQKPIRPMIVLTTEELLELHKNRGNPTLYVHHANWGLGKAHLREYFEKFGEIRKINMYFDEKTGVHQGFSSVTFRDPTSAYVVMTRGNHLVNGQMVNLQYNIPFQKSGFRVV